MSTPEITAGATATLATAREGDTVIVAVVDPQGSMVLHTIEHDPFRLVQVARSLLEQAEDALKERIDEAGCNDQGDHPEEQLLASVLDALESLPAADGE
jgi:hypothetical protein